MEIVSAAISYKPAISRSSVHFIPGLPGQIAYLANSRILPRTAGSLAKILGAVLIAALARSATWSVVVISDISQVGRSEKREVRNRAFWYTMV